MNSKYIDWLNIFLLFLSLFLAFQLPFQVFLYGYAILGPLHYLTEINWLREKKYFVKESRWIWVVLVFSLLIVFPRFFLEPAFSFFYKIDVARLWAQKITQWSNAIIFVCLVSSIGLLYTQKSVHRLGIFLMGCVLAFLLNTLPLYFILVGGLLPTVIHVYLFTLLFMMHGALKSQSIPGFVAVILMIFCPVFIAWTEITPQDYFFSDFIKGTFVENNFHILNAIFARFLGLSDGKSFYFYEKIELKMQIFLSFAYIYHYLNWFSKTTIIGWHKNLSLSRTIGIVIVWLVFVGLFWYNYKLGFYIVLSVSFLHVFLEFPLNILSIQSIFSYLFNFWKKQKN